MDGFNRIVNFISCSPDVEHVFKVELSADLFMFIPRNISKSHIKRDFLNIHHKRYGHFLRPNVPFSITSCHIYEDKHFKRKAKFLNMLMF